MKIFEMLDQTGTYAGVRFDPATTDALIKYTQDGKIPNPLPPKEYHSTILYSSRPCPEYKPLGDLKEPWMGHSPKIEVWPTQSGKRCLVIHYKSDDLENRHNELMKKHNATYDFPEFKSHMTLSYDIGDFDETTLPDITDYLSHFVINHEYYEPLDDNRYGTKEDRRSETR